MILIRRCNRTTYRLLRQQVLVVLSILGVEFGKGVKQVIIKNNATDQFCTMNLPMFAGTREQRGQLKSLSRAYLRSEDPPSAKSNCEYMDRKGSEVVFTSEFGSKTLIIVASPTLTHKQLAQARDLFRKTVDSDEAQFFISKYDL